MFDLVCGADVTAQKKRADLHRDQPPRKGRSSIMQNNRVTAQTRPLYSKTYRHKLKTANERNR